MCGALIVYKCIPYAHPSCDFLPLHFPPPCLHALCVPPQDEDDELTPGYKAPKMVDLKTLQELDAEDESLVKYKQTLLGQTEGVMGKGQLYIYHTPSLGLA